MNAPMTTYEKISLVISSIAIIVAIFSLVKASTSARAAQKSQYAFLELAIREQVNLAKGRILALAEKFSELPLPMEPRSFQDKQKAKTLGGALDAAYEDFLNVYEDACAMYRDGKLDGERFKKSYRSAIRELFSDEHYKGLLDGVSSRYKAIQATYREWEDTES